MNVLPFDPFNPNGSKGKRFFAFTPYFYGGINMFHFNPKTYYNRGTAKSDLNDFLGAVKDYDAAIQLNPEYSMAFTNRANVKADVSALVNKRRNLLVEYPN